MPNKIEEHIREHRVLGLPPAGGTDTTSVASGADRNIFTALAGSTYLVTTYSDEDPSEYAVAIVVAATNSSIGVHTLSFATHSINNSGTTIRINNGHGSMSRTMYTTYIRLR